MRFTVNPYVGADPISFGMTTKEIKEKLSAEPEKFKKFEDDEFMTDVFEWCHVYYKTPGIVEAIEFFAPATVLVNNCNLIGKSFTEVKGYLKKLDDSIEYDESGLTSFKLGLGVFAPFAVDEPSEPIESIIVFEKGYYE